MNTQIRAYADEDLEDIVKLSLLAWEPVFFSFRQILGPKIFPIVYPDWRKAQQEGVETTCSNEEASVLVSEVNGVVVGFVAYVMHEDESAEVVLLAVHPEHQNGGIGTEPLDEPRFRVRVVWLDTFRQCVSPDQHAAAVRPGHGQRPGAALRQLHR